jgi:hypothetical protein
MYDVFAWYCLLTVYRNTQHVTQCIVYSNAIDYRLYSIHLLDQCTQPDPNVASAALVIAMHRMYGIQLHAYRAICNDGPSYYALTDMRVYLAGLAHEYTCMHITAMSVIINAHTL